MASGPVWAEPNPAVGNMEAGCTHDRLAHQPCCLDVCGKWRWISRSGNPAPTSGFTPANVNQIVSDVNIEYKISVEFYGISRRRAEYQ